MKQIKTLIFITLLVALITPTTAFAKEAFDDRVVFGGTFTLESGETQVGSLVVFGGAVTIEPESTVNGDVVLIGGTVEIGGNINGSVVGIGGAVRLNEEAYVNGDLFTLGAALRRAEGAIVNGQVVNGIDISKNLDFPESFEGSDFIPPLPPQTPPITIRSNPVLDIIWFFFRIFLFSALAVILVMFLPKHVDRVTRAALTQPVISAGAGLLTAVLAPLALIVITITIILIPVTIVTVILLVIALLLGWVALGVELGHRISKSMNMEWAPAISAGVGSFILLFVFGGISELVPCIGWIPQTLVGLWGLGAVLLTRFGTLNYSSSSEQIDQEIPPHREDEIPDEENVDEVESSSDENNFNKKEETSNGDNKSE